SASGPERAVRSGRRGKRGSWSDRRPSPHHQRDDEGDQEDEEQDLRDPGGSAGDPAEAEERRDQRDDQECQGPAQHGPASEGVGGREWRADAVSGEGKDDASSRGAPARARRAAAAGPTRNFAESGGKGRPRRPAQAPCALYSRSRL